MPAIRRPAVRLGASLVLALAAGSAFPAGPAAAGVDLAVTVRDASGAVVGTVALRDVGGSTVLTADLEGLTPGFHGFHLHSVGACDPAAPNGPFTTAGGHHVGSGGQHGDHDGDLPSLYAAADGTAHLRVQTDAVTLAELVDDDGFAVMVHSGPDNFANIPTRYVSPDQPGGGPDQATRDTGDSGTRVACGAVVRGELDRLGAGMSLAQGTGLVSRGGAARLVLQSDGNLVVYVDGAPTWATGTRDIAALVMQADGNLVGYTAAGYPRFVRLGEPGTQVVMQDDGNLVTYAPDGHPLWASHGER